MADVILTKGGLKSQAPGQTKFEQRVREAGKRRSSSVTSAKQRRRDENERKLEEENRRRAEEQARAEAERQRVAEEQRKQAEFQRQRAEAKQRFSVEAIRKRAISERTKEKIAVIQREETKPDKFIKEAKKNLREEKVEQMLKGTRAGGTKRDPSKVPEVIRKETTRKKEDTRPSVSPEKILGALTPGSLKETGNLITIAGATAGSSGFVRSGISTTFAVSGGATALDPGRTPEERVAGALIGVGGATGFGAEVSPFIRGTVARVGGAKTPKTEPTPKFKDPQTQAISEKIFGPERQIIPIKEQPISLITEGKGARGVPINLQKSQLGKSVDLATSQRSIIPKGKTELEVLKIPKEPEGVFFTPTPKEIGPATRISRLGLSDPLTFPGAEAKLGVGPIQQPQIITGKGKLTNIGKAGTSELETLVGKIGEKIPVEKQPDVVIRGQKVEVFKMTEKPIGSPGVETLKTPSGRSPTSVPVSSVLSPKITGVVRPSINGRNSPSIKITSKQTSNIIRPSPTIDPTSKPPSLTLTSTTPIPRGRPSPPLRPETPPRVTPRPSPPLRRLTPPRTPNFPSVAFDPFPLTPSKPLRAFSVRRSNISKPKKLKLFTVEERRFGKFKAIGTAPTLQQAVSIGRTRVSRSLGATFRIQGAGKVPVPKGFRRGKTPGAIIEKRKFRLSTKTETGEIQTFKRRKKKKKR